MPLCAGLVAAVLAIPVLAGVAAAAVPADVAARIRSVAENHRTSVAQNEALARMSGDRHLASVSNAMNRRVAASMMAQVVIEAINRNPADKRDVMAAAFAAAPDLRPGVEANLTTAFPAFRQDIAAAAAPPPPPAPPVRRATPEPEPGEDDLDQIAADAIGATEDRDPFEPVNRIIFEFNDFLDTWLMVPIAKAYRFIMPEFARRMGRNFFENFGEPVVAANDVLQGDFGSAGTAVGRFFVNSTVGIFGFFEVAEELGMKEHSADFGQTMHSYGMTPGPYLVLPFLGPTTVRDAIGGGVDSFLNPVTYFIDLETRIYLKASEIVVKRESVLDELAELRKGSLDYYAALRAAWFQNRDRELRKGAPAPAGDLDRLFEETR